MIRGLIPILAAAALAGCASTRPPRGDYSTARADYTCEQDWSCPSAWCKSVSPGGLECAVLSAAQQAGEWEEYR